MTVLDERPDGSGLAKLPASAWADVPLSTFQLAQTANARMEEALNAQAAQQKQPSTVTWLVALLVLLIVFAGVLGMVFLKMNGPERLARETLAGTWDETQTFRSRDGRTATLDTVLVFTAEGTYELIMDGKLVQDGEWRLLETDGTSHAYALFLNAWEYMTFTVSLEDDSLMGAYTLRSTEETSDYITKTFRKTSGRVVGYDSIAG